MSNEQPEEEKPDLSFAEQEALERQKEWEKGDLTELQQAFKGRWMHGKEAELPPLSMLENLEKAIDSGGTIESDPNVSHWLYEIVSFNPEKAYPIMQSLADTGNWEALENLRTMTSNHEWKLVITDEDKEKARRVNEMIQREYEELIESKPTITGAIKKKMGGIGKKLGL